jgi:hypothetical protein
MAMKYQKGTVYLRGEKVKKGSSKARVTAVDCDARCASTTSDSSYNSLRHLLAAGNFKRRGGSGGALMDGTDC